jgi:hypothetical protein
MRSIARADVVGASRRRSAPTGDQLYTVEPGRAWAVGQCLQGRCRSRQPRCIFGAPRTPRPPRVPFWPQRSAIVRNERTTWSLRSETSVVTAVVPSRAKPTSSWRRSLQGNSTTCSGTPPPSLRAHIRRYRAGHGSLRSAPPTNFDALEAAIAALDTGAESAVAISVDGLDGVLEGVVGGRDRFETRVDRADHDDAGARDCLAVVVIVDREIVRGDQYPTSATR